jgi:nucleoside-triphosphatase
MQSGPFFPLLFTSRYISLITFRLTFTLSFCPNGKEKASQHQVNPMSVVNILLSGPPRSGKSTLIEKVVRQIKRPATGFFTRELREKGIRVGFRIDTLDGKTGLLAHQNIKSKYRVGKYGVNLEDIDQIAVPSMLPSVADQIVVIDEIGKMECFSRLFKETLLRVLFGENQVIGSIAIKGDRFIQSIKDRDDVILVSISESTRDLALELLLQKIRG